MDAGGTIWQVGAPAQVFTNGNCGTSEIQLAAPTEGQCSFPPSGWVTQYSTSTLSVDPIYWSHPSNPLANTLAYAGGSFVYNSSSEIITNYPDTYYSNSALNDNELLHEVIGLDGWRLQIRYQQWNNGYSAVEDDLDP